MHRSLILGLAAASCLAGGASAHAIFPGSQTVQTLGERAFVKLQAVNSRKDVSRFVVEIFDGDSWRPSRIAVATPERLVVPSQDGDAMESTQRSISILVDLDGKNEQRLRVCTKSVPNRDMFRPRMTELTTRVCSNVTVQRFR